MTSYVDGNGVREEIQLDQRGRIIELAATAPPAQQASADDSARWPNAAAWFAARHAGVSSIYRQRNQYDSSDRITTIERELAAAPGATRATTRTEQFGYDHLNRLVTTRSVDASTSYTYDRGGNRTSSQEGQARHVYRYAPGTNRLQMQDLDTLWAYHPSGVPLARFALATAASSQRIVYDLAHRPVAVYDGTNRLLVSYYYNRTGERIAKTVHDSSPSALPAVAQSPASQHTTYSLYRDQRLAAETDADGHITAHYLYLNGKPIAKVVMQADTSWAATLQRRMARLSRPFSASATAPTGNAPTTSAHLYAIHTDHLGTPQAATDAQRHLVWQAATTPFGVTRILYAAGATAQAPAFTLDLRLPGQVYDAETGLHYNYQRDYDPALGRYLTADPIGLAGGTQPYGYAGGNPLMRVDALGLYEEDVHYYMTFFLARTAGIGYQEARTIALASQYIDENPDTWPMDDKDMGANVDQFNNGPVLDRLAAYHFTTSSRDFYNPIVYDPKRTISELLVQAMTNYDLPTYTYRRVKNPTNPQLNRLLAAAQNAPTICSQAQLFGEYLHAFADTFSHRDQYNDPIKINAGLGHGAYGHSPDKTYNHYVSVQTLVDRNSIIEHFLLPEYGPWNYNEQRTLEMESEVFKKLQQLHGTSAPNINAGKPLDIKSLEPFLRSWNKLQSEAEKIEALSFALDDYGLGDLPVFNRNCAAKNRDVYLQGLQPSKSTGVILPSKHIPDTGQQNPC